ncbi:hypothetical protein C8R47DRAFT_1262472 [Mycena vitilis]|nr:hypothetical protein C8R47DRAFT_1262472 [Mycena vitilis]
MPPQPSVTQSRLNNIKICLAATADSFKALATGLKDPSIELISYTTKSLLKNVELLEQTHELLNAVLVTYLKSDTGIDLAPDVLSVEAQQKGSKIKRLLRQGDLSALLKGCMEGLQQGLDSFQIGMGAIMKDLAEVQKESEERHKEVLLLIEVLTDASSDQASTISRVYSGSHNRIFHGRDAELSKILQLFTEGNPRIAILASSKVELAAHIGVHLGLKPGRDLTRAVVQHLSSKPASLLILDNLETVWEPMECRKEVEEFLSLLTDVKHLALIVTMRGAERPAQVAWSHPFLPPLKPLEQDAARQMFIDIADDGHNPEDIDQILALTDNMPLAISLLAHLADSEGCPTVLTRWDEEKTSVVSYGWDRKSNLDMSISLSLSSPRLQAFHHSQKLLSLLAMLPNGLSDAELVQSKLPIDKVLGCKGALIGTSLAYSDSNKRLKVLVPIREYMMKAQPSEDNIIRPLRKYFQKLLEHYKDDSGTPGASTTVARISSNLANIQNILENGLRPDHPDLVDCIYGTCDLNRFSVVASQGEQSLMMRKIPNIFPVPLNHRLEGYFILELLNSWNHGPIGDLDTVINQGLTHIEQCDDLDLKCRFYLSLTQIYRVQRTDLSAALDCAKTALSLATSTENTKRQAQALHRMAWINWNLGYYSVAQRYAKESQRTVRTSADLYSEAEGLRIEATCWFSLGDYNQSLSLCNWARDLIAACGMSKSTLDHALMSTQAEAHKLKSEYTEARNIHQKILQETSVTQGLEAHAMALLNMAESDVSTEVPEEAIQRNIDSARKLFSTVEHEWGAVACDAVLADLALRDRNQQAAKSVLSECLNWSWEKSAEITSYCLEQLGDVSRWEPSIETSNWATVLLAHSLKVEKKLLVHKALLSLGQIFNHQADEDTAMNLFNVALEGFTSMDVHRSRAECMLYLGDIYKGHGDLLKAVELWDTAKPLFERSSQGKQVKKIDERLNSVGEDLLEQHRKSLALLAELNAPSETLEETEDELSDAEDIQEELIDQGKVALVLA